MAVSLPGKICWCFEGEHQDLSIHVVRGSVDRGSHVDIDVDIGVAVEDEGRDGIDRG